LESLIHFFIVDKALYVADIDVGSKIFLLAPILFWPIRLMYQYVITF
ncbi:unnamed protein product, partial [Brassica rapa subsp. trilocularis]